ncbi:hypothetical protein [Vibrio cholerae]|uniref:hypothetical protein n=1 Tax=Vibrio cholerae TaxID=666 RepID=UPI00163BA13E|nr:hypothetical protein [Vibrio cholerae]
MKTVVIYCLGVLTPVVGYFLFGLFSGHIDLYLEMLTTSFTFIMMVCAVVALNTWRRQISQEAIYKFEFCGMRCQPLRRALCAFSKNLEVV